MIEPMSVRICKKCNQSGEFSKSKNPHVWCKRCCRENATASRRANPERERRRSTVRSKTPEWREYKRNYDKKRYADPAVKKSRRLYILARKYGITAEQYNDMLQRQEGRCAICRGSPGKKGFNVDHNHKTKEVRGLLCTKCNRGLGYLGDSPVRLRIAIEYLEYNGQFT